MAPMSAKLTLLVAAILSLFSGSHSSDTHYGVPEAPPSTRAHYAYAYDVRDPQSGVYSSKKETRDGDVVYGNYVVEDPDGTRRSVHYSSDSTRGVNADIRRPSAPQQLQEQVHTLPVPIPVALPVVQTYVAPAPAQVHQIQFGTPVAYSLAPAILTRASSDNEASQYHHTSLTSPTHSYTY